MNRNFRSAGTEAEARHLMDLSDVIEAQHLFDSASQSIFSERDLPGYLREWRMESSKSSKSSEKQEALSSQESSEEKESQASCQAALALFQLDFLYASPLLWSAPGVPGGLCELEMRREAAVRWCDSEPVGHHV